MGNCCLEDDFSEECRSSENRECSETFTKQKHMFFSYCMQSLSPKFCTDNSSSLILEAKSQPQYFNFDNIQKFTCTYQIVMPDQYYNQASLYIQFIKLKNVQIYINGGLDIRTASYEMSVGNASVEINKIYSL